MDHSEVHCKVTPRFQGHVAVRYFKTLSKVVRSDFSL